MNREIDLTHGLDTSQVPQNYIRFGKFSESDRPTDCTHCSNCESCSDCGYYFNSRRFGLYLHERIAPTPPESEVTARIPFRQGVVDMSNLLGNRIYNNREITFVFYRFGVQKNISSTARDFQTTIENLLMREFDQRLDDSFEPDFHYVGKCKEVLVTDEYHRNRLRVEITFDLYPFKIDNHMESADLFDAFNFDIDAFQRIEHGLSFNVSGTTTIKLYNSGQKVLTPTVHVSGGDVTLTCERTVCRLEEDSSRQYPGFRMLLGMNIVTLSVSGAATVNFDWRKERI